MAIAYMERRCDMERLKVYETDKGNYAVRPECWAVIIDKNGRIKECGLNHTAIFHYEEDAKWYADAKNAEDEEVILRLPCRLGDIINRIISHNEIVTLMFETEVCSFRGLQHFWHGMAWNIPKEYLELPFVKIHGVVPDKITEADTIWIEVRKEAEQALAKIEKEK